MYKTAKSPYLDSLRDWIHCAVHWLYSTVICSLQEYFACYCSDLTVCQFILSACCLNPTSLTDNGIDVQQALSSPLHDSEGVSVAEQGRCR